MASPAIRRRVKNGFGASDIVGSLLWKVIYRIIGFQSNIVTEIVRLWKGAWLVSILNILITREPSGENRRVPESPSFQRSEVYFSGRVQGVGFRYTTQRIAGRFSVTGFVRNLPDGRVHLVAEGTRNELTSFLQDLEQAMSGHIHESHRADEDATGEFAAFEIRH